MLGLGSSNLGIGISVNLRNNFTNEANRISNSMTKMNNTSNRMLRSNLVAVRNLSAGTAAAGFLLSKSMYQSFNRSMAFTKQLKFIETISGSSAEEIKTLKKEIFDLSDAYGFSSKDIAGAAKDLVKAGSNLQQTKEALKPIANMAIIADMPMANSAEMLVNVMANFQLGADKFKHASNVMALAANSSTVDIKDLFEAVKYAGPELKNLNIPLAESMALLATAGQAGLKGSIGGTSVGNMLRYLAKAGSNLTGTKKQSSALAVLGMGKEDIVDSQGNLKNLIGLLDKLKERTKGLGTAQKVSVLEAIFGVRGVRGIMPLLNMLDNAKMGKSLKELSKDLANVKDNYGDLIAAKVNDNLAGDVNKLRESWENLQLTLTGDKEGFLRGFVKGITKVINLSRKFAETPLGKILFGAAMVLGPALLVMGTFGVALSSIGLALNQTGIGFSNMARSAKWAFLKMTTWAMGYNAVSGAGAGLTFNKSLGRWTAASRGGKMVKGAVAARYMQRFGSGASLLQFGNFGRMLSSFLPTLGRVLGVFTRFLPLAGIIITIVSLLWDFKDIIKGVLTALGEMMLGVMYMKDFLTPGVDAGSNYSRNRNKMYSKIWGSTPEEEAQYQESFKTVPIQRNMDGDMRDKVHQNLLKYKTQNVVNVNIDGNKVQQSVTEAQAIQMLSGTPLK